MIQPASSVVMHAQAKEPARDGTGTSTSTPNPAQETTARARTVRPVRAGASASPSYFDALQRGRAHRLRISKAPVSADTLYCRKCRGRSPADPNRPCAAAGIRWGRGQDPGPVTRTFPFLNPLYTAGLGSPAHEKGPGRMPDDTKQFKCLLDPASCAVACCTEPTPPLPVRASSPRQRGREPRAGTRGPFPKPGFQPKPTLALGGLNAAPRPRDSDHSACIKGPLRLAACAYAAAVPGRQSHRQSALSSRAGLATQNSHKAGSGRTNLGGL